MARGPLVGLDIGKDYIKIAELRKQGKVVTLHYADSEPLPADASSETKKDVIKALFSRAATKTKICTGYGYRRCNYQEKASVKPYELNGYRRSLTCRW